MIQSFQCPICGNLNAIGEPACTRCGQNFVYNCPVCGSPVSNRYNKCHSCNTLFNWSTPYQQIIPADSSAGMSEQVIEQDIQEPSIRGARGNAAAGRGITSRPAFWVMLMGICVLIIAVLLIIDRIISS